MDLDFHIRLAQRALEAGYLDRRAFEGAMSELAEAGGGDLEAFWVRSGRLSASQFQSLRSLLLAGDVSTAPRGSWPPDGGQAAIFTGSHHSDGDEETMPPGPMVDLVSAESAPGSIRLDGDGLWAGRYRPIRLIGLGGTGRVFECDDTRLGRRVAVKIPLSTLARDERIMETLRREAHVTGGLEHPSIVPVYDVAEETSENLFYVMRLVNQPTLEDVINRLVIDPKASAEYSLGRLLRYFVQICLALDFAHDRGVIHCDLKPANILVGGFGEVLVLDWGMAFRAVEDSLRGGGTPGFMPPEQLDADATRDARTDVFALGAILFEMICLTPAYPVETWEALMSIVHGAMPFPPVLHPRERCPDRPIPDELADICVKAMQLDPGARHPSARALAADVEAFLEGTKERERKLRRAADLVEEGLQLELMYREYVEQRPAMIRELSRIRARTPPWEGPDEKRNLWDAEDRLTATDAVGARTFHAAVAAYEQAIDEVGRDREAQHGLARLYWSELQLARERCDYMSQLFFGELFKQYDDNSVSEAWGRRGDVEIACDAADVEVVVAEYEEQERRLQPVRPSSLGRGPTVVAKLTPGTYIATLRVDERKTASLPLLVRSGRGCRLAVDVEAVRQLAPHECYVAAGTALVGGDEQSLFGLERTEIDVPAFVVFERHVTFGDYVDFLTDRVREDPSAAERLTPRSNSGMPYLRYDGDAFVAATTLHGRAPLVELPVFGVDHAAAEAYAAWYAEKHGRPYRLPREDEWEKAARGVDGRRYPWGEYFDASFCLMAESRREAARPEPPGASASDVSPYGVRDTAGGVAEWMAVGVTDPPEWAAVRGGAWCDRRHDCALSVRRLERKTFRSARIGFRLARDLN